MDAKTPIKKARSRKTLNADNLEALGAARLAAILVEVAGGQPTTKRRLRMELAAQVGADDLVLELDKALDALGGARTRVHWRRLKALRQDLELLRGMIAGRLAEADPAAAIRLLLRFIGMERGVLARLSDSKGEIGQVFADALGDLARLAATAGPPAFGAIDVVFEALDNARLGAMGDIVQALVPALDAEAIARLRARVETETAPRRRTSAGWRDALQALMDAQGDAEAYAATYSASEAGLASVGARIARRFLKAGRIAEAEQALEASNPHAEAAGRAQAPTTEPGLLAWTDARIDLLEARGDRDAAQAARWAAFERDLAADPLRAYVRRLADFDDIVATDRAIALAMDFRPFTRALAFLVDWPALPEAAGLIRARTAEIDGAAIDTLEPAARALEARHPLAATLLLRAMVTEVVKGSRAHLFPRARAWMMEAASLSTQITDFQDIEDHAAFERRVRAALKP